MSQRILFITATRIGDAVLSSGILSILHERYPSARFTIAAGPVAAPLFSEVPRLEQLVPLRKGPFARHWRYLWRKTFRCRWDVIVDFRRSAMRLLLRSDARYVLGPDRPGMHKVVQAAAMLGLQEAPPRPRLWVGQSQMQTAAGLVPSGPPVLALGPTANWVGKQWPSAQFIALARQLTAPDGAMPGARIAVFSAPGERQTATTVMQAFPDARVIDLAGKTDILTAYACLSRCRLYVGNDSGLMHLAAAAGVPTLGLFGPSKQTHYAPWGADCDWVRTPESFDEIVGQPGYDPRSGKSYMTTLDVPPVLAAATALLARTRDKISDGYGVKA